MSGLGKDEAYQIESRKWDTQGAYKLIVKKKSRKKTIQIENKWAYDID